MKESDLLKRIQVSASKIGARLFRNNVALAWTGELFRTNKATTIMMFPGDVLLRKARPLHAGLMKGSSDLIGWTPVKITQQMVGGTVAVFTAIEGKTGYLKATPEQDQFIATVIQAGGIATVARNELDAMQTISDE